MPTPGSKTARVTKATAGTGRRRITPAHEAAVAKEEQEAAKPYRRGALAAVEEYVLKNPGAHLWTSDIMRATDLDKRAVQAAMGDLIRRGGYASRITVIRPGNAWRLREDSAPAVRPVPDTMTDPGKPRSSAKLADLSVVGEYEGGALIITVDGKPYLAKPIV